MSQITAHEEQITEYTDKIAVMEEELKKVAAPNQARVNIQIYPDFEWKLWQ